MKNLSDFIFKLAIEAGRIAHDMQGKARSKLKADASIVTEADLAVSTLVRIRLVPLLAQGHILIDEETISTLPAPTDPMFTQAEYLWVCDPIDGTLPFSLNMPLWGVSIGLLKNGVPHMGAVYHPAPDELFFHDGTAAWFIKHPGQPHEQRVQITPQETPLSHNSIFFLAANRMNGQAAHKQARQFCAMDIFSSCYYHTWPAIGRGDGALTQASLWDMAGSWPIFRAAGFELFDAASGTLLNRFDPAAFTSTWGLRRPLIMCRPAQLPFWADMYQKYMTKPAEEE